MPCASAFFRDRLGHVQRVREIDAVLHAEGRLSGGHLRQSKVGVGALPSGVIYESEGKAYFKSWWAPIALVFRRIRRR